MRFIPMKPHKISEGDLDLLQYPILVQPKFDGIRCLVKTGEVLSYNLKPIPNKYIQNIIKSILPKQEYNIYDGELLLNDKQATFQDVQSAVMSRDGSPNFSYIIFDVCSLLIPDMHYVKRLDIPVFDVSVVSHIKWGTTVCKNKNAVLVAEAEYLRQGYEGIILRSPIGYYKFGRSTLKEGYLLALKRFSDAEAIVMRCFPMEKNINEQEEDHHGHAKRSSQKEGMVELDTLGSLEVTGLNGKYAGKTFNVGGGFTFKQRDEIWEANKKGNVYGTVIKYKYFEVGSTDEAPRQPVFTGFRDRIDF